MEGSINLEVFEAYVERVLAATLHPGQIVVMDNVSAHKRKGVKEIIEKRGCVLFLPPYSPDFTPIEEAFSKVKGLLCKAAPHSRKALVEAMGAALAVVGASDAQCFFEHCGYYQLAHLP